MKPIEARQNNDKILLELSSEEAIVLFDWLSRFNEVETPILFKDKAEERVLWDMEAVLEKVTAITFDCDYTTLVSEAREKVRDTLG